jgi:hypothetical protein
MRVADDPGTVNHDDDRMRFDAILLSQSQPIMRGIIGAYHGQTTSKSLCQPINDRHCSRSRNSAIRYRQTTMPGPHQGGGRSNTTTHQESHCQASKYAPSLHDDVPSAAKNTAHDQLIAQCAIIITNEQPFTLGVWPSRPARHAKANQPHEHH